MKFQTSQTNVATSIAFLAVSLLPTAFHLPAETERPRIACVRDGNLEYKFASEMGAEQRYAQILEKFATRFFDNLIDTEPDIAKLTKDHFLEMYEDF